MAFKIDLPVGDVIDNTPFCPVILGYVVQYAKSVVNYRQIYFMHLELLYHAARPGKTLNGIVLKRFVTKPICLLHGFVVSVIGENRKREVLCLYAQPFCPLKILW